jgi:hypothetical protein
VLTEELLARILFTEPNNSPFRIFSGTLDTTKQELTKMQADLDQGRWDNNILNDVIDSIRKSSNDDRLAQRDRAVLADDLARLKQFQDQHNQH